MGVERVIPDILGDSGDALFIGRDISDVYDVQEDEMSFESLRELRYPNDLPPDPGEYARASKSKYLALRALGEVDEPEPGSDSDAWLENARCFGEKQEDFFPTGAGGANAKVCDSCEVKSECLEYALKNGIDHGVWGGTSPRQRRIIRRQRERAESGN